MGLDDLVNKAKNKTPDNIDAMVDKTATEAKDLNN